jgi:hypothetical protein
MTLFVVSCIPEQESIGDAGQTYIKLFPAGFKLVAVNAQATTQTVVLFEIRRDPNSSAALNTATTVVIQFDTDTAILDAYNAAHSTTFIPLDPSLATTLPALVSGKITFNFEPGVASMPLKAVIPNSAGFDFGKKYALAYKLLSVSGTGVISEAVGDEVVVQVMAKNKYDGKYKMKGWIMRPGDTGGLEGYFTGHEHKLSTSGATSCTMSPNQQWANGGGVGGIGTWTITVDESGPGPTYPITVTDPLAVNWLMDPTYNNHYDATTKTYFFKVNWGAAIPYTRGCTDTLVYFGPSK